MLQPWDISKVCRWSRLCQHYPYAKSKALHNWVSKNKQISIWAKPRINIHKHVEVITIYKVDMFLAHIILYEILINLTLVYINILAFALTDVSTKTAFERPGSYLKLRSVYHNQEVFEQVSEVHSLDIFQF